MVTSPSGFKAIEGELKKEGSIKEKLECLLLNVKPAYSARENKAQSQDQYK